MTAVSRKARRLIGLLTICLVLLGGWVVTRPALPRGVILPDGRSVSILAVTYGTEHRFLYGLPWLKVAAPVLPRTWAKRLGLHIIESRSAVPTLMVWSLWQSSPKSTLPPSLFMAVADAEGLETTPAYRKTDAYPKNWHAIMGWECTNFPRRAESLRARFYDIGNDGRPRRVAEFSLANPAARQYPVWNPPALPVSQTVQEAQFTLVDFKAGGSVPEQARMSLRHFEPDATLVFRVSEAGQTSLNWRLDTLEITDATGNFFPARPVAGFSVGEYLVFCFQGVLWSSESAWKLKADFYRTANFPPADLISIASIAIPAPGQQISLETTREWPETSLRGLQLKGVPPSNFSLPRMPQWNLELTGSLVPPSPGLRLALLRAVDDRGRTLPLEAKSRDVYGHGNFRLEAPPDARKIDLSLALQRVHTIELTAPAERKAWIAGAGEIESPFYQTPYAAQTP